MSAQYATENGETPLMKASANGHWPVCDYLVKEKAKVNHHDADYQTALMWAAAEGHKETVEGLAAADAKIDIVTKQGKTALMLAAKFGRFEVYSTANDHVPKFNDCPRRLIAGMK